jgi:hypothetical protein
MAERRGRTVTSSARDVSLKAGNKEAPIVGAALLILAALVAWITVIAGGFEMFRWIL